MPSALLLKKIKLHFIYFMWVYVPWATWESWFSFFYHVGPRNQTCILRLDLINGAQMAEGRAHARQVFHSSGTPAPHWQSMKALYHEPHAVTISWTHRVRCNHSVIGTTWTLNWKLEIPNFDLLTLKPMICSEHQNTTASCSAGLTHTQ